MLHHIILSKRANTLNKVSCTCGLKQFFTNGIEAEYCANTHASKNLEHNPKITIVNDDVVEPENRRRAKPGRNPGGVHLAIGSDDGNYAFSQ